jgi:hypothetical protein
MAKANSKAKKPAAAAPAVGAHSVAPIGAVARKEIVLAPEHSELVREASYQIEALGDELLSHVRKIEADTAEEIQSVSTMRAIACRVKALSYVARDFAFDPESGVTKDEVAGLRRVVHDGAEYSAAMALAEQAAAA